MIREDWHTARAVASGAVAEIGRWRALCWSIGLIEQVGWRELPDIAMLAAAALVVSPDAHA